MDGVRTEELDCLECIPDAVEAHHNALTERTKLGVGRPNRYMIHLTKLERGRTLGTASYTMYGGKKDITLYINDTSLPELTDTIGHELDHAHFFDSEIWKRIHAAGIWARSFVEKEEQPTYPLSEVVKHARLIAFVRPLLEARAYFTTGVIRGESLESLAVNTRQMILGEYVNRIYIDRMNEETVIQLALSERKSGYDIPDEQVERVVDTKVKPAYESGVEMAIRAVKVGFEDVSRFERAQEARTLNEYYDICMGK